MRAPREKIGQMKTLAAWRRSCRCRPLVPSLSRCLAPEEALECEVSRGGEEERLADEDDEQPCPGRHPGLGLFVIEAVDVVDVHRLLGVGQLRAGGWQPEIADEHDGRAERDPMQEGAAVVAEALDDVEQQEWQPAMKERDAAGGERDLRVEHVI